MQPAIDCINVFCHGKFMGLGVNILTPIFSPLFTSTPVYGASISALLASSNYFTNATIGIIILMQIPQALYKHASVDILFDMHTA